MKVTLIVFLIFSVLLSSCGWIPSLNFSGRPTHHLHYKYQYYVKNNCSTDIYFRIRFFSTDYFTYKRFIPIGEWHLFSEQFRLANIRFEVKAMKSREEDAGYMLSYEEISPITIRYVSASDQEHHSTILCGVTADEVSSSCENDSCAYFPELFARDNWLDSRPRVEHSEREDNSTDLLTD